ncbi:MAG: CrcB family protein [Ferrovum myxofaciens]
MGGYGFLAVGVGAALGAWLRWWLGILLNPLIPTMPLGTLAANLIGGYLVGLAVAYFTDHAGLPRGPTIHHHGIHGWVDHFLDFFC